MGRGKADDGQLMLHVTTYYPARVIHTVEEMAKVGLFPTRSEAFRYLVINGIFNDPYLMHLWEEVGK